jgi:glycosyltransferase involved in cell wall biosynthesis
LDLSGITKEYYSDKEKYTKMIEKFNLQNKVKLFNDFIPADEVKYFFSAADAVLLPYKNATQSGIIQIANNFKKPVIATNVGGLGEMVLEGKTGYVVPPDNPQEFAEALQKFYENYDEDYYTQNVGEEARKYSWETFTNELLSFSEEGLDE